MDPKTEPKPAVKAPEPKAVEPKTEPKAAPAPRSAPEPKTFRVIARHTPLTVKNLTVKAADDGDALLKFCEHNKVQAAEVLKRNKKSPAPQGVEDFLANRHLYPDVAVIEVA